MALAGALLVVLPGAAASRLLDASRIAADCTRTSVGFTALPDLGTGQYRGYQGGLYPEGRNRPPAPYLAQGTAARDLVRPIDGKIVLLSIGMSNTTQEYSGFKRHADRELLRNPAVTVVDGAQGGQDAERIRDPASPYWQFIDQRLIAAGATPQQVQAVWLKEAIAGENRAFPGDAQRTNSGVQKVANLLLDFFERDPTARKWFLRPGL